MAKEGFIGKIDAFADGFLRGWVFDTAHPRRRQCVDVFAGSAFLGQTACGFHRPDLEAAGFGDGRHEFLIRLGGAAALAPSDISVRVSGAPHVVLALEGAGAEEMPQDASDQARRKAYFESLVAGLRLRELETRRARCEHGLLVGSVPVHGIPLSRFAIHIAHKFGYDITGKDGLRRFLGFYLERYSPYKAPHRLPFAPEESRFWAAPENQACRAADSFAPPPTRQSPTDRIFAWAVHDATRLGVEDAWIDDSLVAYLQGDPSLFARARDFPINRFMRRFLEQNAALDGLRWKDVGDRQIAYAAAVLHAARAPHLSRLLPKEWVDRLVARRDDETCLLSDVLARVLGRVPDLGPITVRSVRPAAPPPPAGETKEVVDVQLIGPFDRVLGLSESCRRFAEAVRACGYRVAFANYDIGSASPREPQGAISDELVEARVNILHLNLEEIPEALAFALAPLVGTYLIAIPYFELSALSKCHELGLRMIDEIWAPSRFLRDLFGAAGKASSKAGGRTADRASGKAADKAADKATVLMPLPVRAPADPCREAARAHVLAKLDRTDPVTLFLATADALSWIGRKHTVGVLDAFQAAFVHDEPVCLVVKIHNIDRMSDATQSGIWAEIVSRAEDDPRIVLMQETIAAEAYRALLAGVDCLVSLHRAEGLGLDILDAMMLGTAVVATAYSGNVDVCDATTSWPVPFDLVPVGVGNYPFAEPGHVWAEPRLPAAAAALRDVHARPAERAARTAHARARIAEHNDLVAAAARIGARVKAILATL